MSASHLENKQKFTNINNDLYKVKQQVSEKSKEIVKLKSDFKKLYHEFNRKDPTKEMEQLTSEDITQDSHKKTSSNPNAPYVLEFYKKRLEEKNYEVCLESFINFLVDETKAEIHKIAGRNEFSKE